MFRHRVSWLSTLALVLISADVAVRAQSPPSTPRLLSPQPWTSPREAGAETHGELVKVGRDLAHLYDEHRAHRRSRTRQPFQARNSWLRLDGDRVAIDAVAAGDAGDLRAALEALGLEGGATFGRVVSGWLPIPTIAEAAGLASLRFARPAYSLTRVGATTSQGDDAMRSDVARATFGVDGTGVTVGTLSDSYDCLGGAAGDVASGDLPPGITVLAELPGCAGGSDEGRAMMQIIADVAPGASQAFHTAAGGQASFASGILDLATVAGAEVIVDDIGYFDEPMFQDGVIAQAVDTVAGMGVAYFSAAGNSARQSYEGAFVPSGFTVLGAFEAHDFDPGPGVDVFQSISLPVGGGPIALQWDEPFFSISGAPGSSSDLQVYLADAALTTIVASSTDANVGGDPSEVIPFVNPGPATSFNLFIERATPPGTDPGKMKYILFRAASINEYDTASSTIFGHPNAAGGVAVGAANYFDTPEFGTDPALLASYSSAGPAEILFSTGGAPISETRDKPEIVCPDAGNTTFFISGLDVEPDGFPNFPGTSAAAPHAAGIAALIRELVPSLSPAGVYSALEGTADDMGPPGFDADSGFGLCQADQALAQASLIFEDGFESGDLSLWSTVMN